MEEKQRVGRALTCRQCTGEAVGLCVALTVCACTCTACRQRGPLVAVSKRSTKRVWEC